MISTVDAARIARGLAPPPNGMSLPADNIIGPNCGVSAVSVAAGVSFQRAWKVLSFARGLGRQCAGDATPEEIAATLRYLGVRFRAVMLPPKRLTLTRFVFDIAKPGRHYMVFNARHVVVVQDRLVVDQQGLAAIIHAPARNKPVTSALLIEKPCP